MVEICTVKVCITKIANVKQKKILSIVTRKKKIFETKKYWENTRYIIFQNKSHLSYFDSLTELPNNLCSILLAIKTSFHDSRKQEDKRKN